jgi:hypothetical protein
MKTRLILISSLLAFGLALTSLASADTEQCAMCHAPQSESLNPGHQDCSSCHLDYDAHLDNPMEKFPKDVTVETCQTCHEPTEEFKADPHHDMGMECSACHTIHDSN